MDPTETYRKAVINFLPANSAIPSGVDGVDGGMVKCGGKNVMSVKGYIQTKAKRIIEPGTKKV